MPLRRMLVPMAYRLTLRVDFGISIGHVPDLLYVA